jgi:hypothetical protein
MVMVPTINAPACGNSEGRNAETTTAAKNGDAAIRLRPQGTPTFLPQTLQVAGMAGPRWERRSHEMPGCPQCGHAYKWISRGLTARANRRRADGA